MSTCDFLLVFSLILAVISMAIFLPSLFSFIKVIRAKKKLKAIPPQMTEEEASAIIEAFFESFKEENSLKP